MKKFIILIGVLIAVVVAGIAFFVATFDANKYKDLIETKAGEAIGSRVKIGSVDLRIGAGLALGIKELGVYEGESASPALSVANAEVSLKLMPLLRKSVEVASVRVDQPKLTVVREADAVRVLGVNPPQVTQAGGAAKPASGQTSGVPTMAFLISEVKVTEGEITYRDATVSPASVIAVKHLNVTVKNVSLAGPVRFEAAAAIFGERPNVRASGEAANLVGGKPELRNLAASVDLGLIDFAALERGVPAIKQSGLRNELAGKIEVGADRLVVGPKGPENFKVNIKMTGGRFGLKTVKPYFENIAMSAEADDKVARLNDLSLQFSDGTVKAKGSAQNYLQTPTSEVDLSVKSVRIDPLVPLTSEGKPLVEGAMSFAFKGSAVGAAWPQISQTLNGRAVLGLEKGILLNLNIIRELLGKLTMFPGLVQSLENSLPESYKPKLTRQSTILNPMEHAFDIKDGTVLIRDLQASTDFFAARLDADARLSGSLDGRGSVQLDKTFSKSMIEGFPETEFLLNGISQIELPLIIKYAGGRLSVLPDLKQVVKNLTSGSGKAAIASLLGGGSSASAAPAAQSAPAAQPAGQAGQAPAPASAPPASAPPASLEDQALGWLSKQLND